MPSPTAQPQPPSRRVRRLAATLLIAGLTALAAAQTASFDSDYYGFGFDYPASWTLEYYGDWLEFADVHDGVAFVQTDAYGIDGSQPDEDPEEVLERALGVLERRLWELEVFSSGPVTIAGRTVWHAAYVGVTDVDDWEAVWYGDDWADDDWDEDEWYDDWPEAEIGKRGDVYVFVSSEVLLIVTAEAPSSEYEAYRPTFDQIVSSLHFHR